MRCKGITIRATQCLLSAYENDCYCKGHSLDRVPNTPKIDGWVSTSQLTILEFQLKTLESARYHFNYAMSSLNESNNDKSIVYSIRFLKVTTILLLNPELARGDRAQMIIDKLINRMKSYPHLASYCEYFARKLSVKHREDSKKRFVESVITESILGQDIASVIIGFM
jgi:hypothetical protein